MGYLLASPLRALSENPKRILGPLVRPGITAVDVGCAMGFFSLPLARMVGAEGRVVCVDLQRRMLTTLQRRARRRGLDQIIETRQCSEHDLGLDDLDGQADLVLAAHVVHEVPHPAQLFATCRTILRPGGRLLLIEPTGHVSTEEFEATTRLARAAGLVELELAPVGRSHQMLLECPRSPALALA
jgi:2-polyprenyl-3-methyl-5-hydroxy-6-metoxy-1,4-benzoquinol methylase